MYCLSIFLNNLVTPEHVRVCSPEKTPADGIYILHDTIQNGHIVYKQLENVGTGKLPN